MGLVYRLLGIYLWSNIWIFPLIQRKTLCYLFSLNCLLQTLTGLKLQLLLYVPSYIPLLLMQADHL